MAPSTGFTRRLCAALAAAALAAATVTAPSTALAGDDPVSAAVSPGLVGRYETRIGDDPATVHYPVGRGAVPVALLLQGANVPAGSYGRFAGIVAGFGFAVAVPDHRRAVGPVSGLFPEQVQVNAVAAWAEAENSREGSPIAGRLDAGRLVLLGHSFGAAAGLFAVGNTCAVPFCSGPVYRRPASLRAAVFHGAGTAAPGGGTVPIDNTGVPVALIQGGMDGVNPPAVARATYDGLGSPPKAFVTVTGANHFGLTDTQTPPGALPDPSPQALPQQESIDAAARWSALFLRASLGDPLAAAYVYGFGDASDDDVTVVSRR
ncbi:putative dienelactone hydrolase [Streptosporangium becharense]|uniref:Putative dienelactone hydrolase n=1 Tax=Streptosporangium becharense TaxID=1816182 RepID=A0A7W9INL4_9ACTN|nr:alpha/beta hydrolase [Streptosporangium becharense]MBB2914327.1 putative dienelactone hydrolase [Streptosporangium becharense]MBB5823641.1 putative dienelactone hydrolase [Streptosporangium becharense]